MIEITYEQLLEQNKDCFGFSPHPIGHIIWDSRTPNTKYKVVGYLEGKHHYQVQYHA